MRFDIPSILYDVPDDDHLRGVYGAYWETARDIARLVALRTRVGEAQAWRCCYCGVRTDHGGGREVRPTLEHVVPRARGGEDTWENAVLACAPCNVGRGETPIAEERFLEGGSCDEPSVVPQMGWARSRARRVGAMRADLRTPEGWDCSDARLAERHRLPLWEVAKFRAHHAFQTSVREAGDGTCPACERPIRDDGALITCVEDGVRRFEVVHRRCYPNYRRWLGLQGMLVDVGGTSREATP